MFAEANEELELVTAEVRDASEVLAIRVEIYRSLKRWELLQVVAKQLALREPDEPRWQVDWAYATRRADRIKAARLILVNAVERQPDVAIFHYNLACYECRLGELEVAKFRLLHAFNLEPRYRIVALEDDDLEPLWNSLGAGL
jgi:hypothetical protein